jgi:hypothetical protein
MTKYRSFLASKTHLTVSQQEKSERKSSNRHNTVTMAHVNKFLLKLKPKGHEEYMRHKNFITICAKILRKKRNET